MGRGSHSLILYVAPIAIGNLFALVLGASLIAFTAYTTALKHIPVSIVAVIATSEAV